MAIKSTPSSITEAYRVLNGSQPGNYGQAQLFLKGMSSEERKGRHRSEKQSRVRKRKRKRPMGLNPYPVTSRRYK